MDFADDILFSYLDFGVQVTHTPKAGGTPASGLAIFDQPGMTIMAGEVLATDLGLRYPTATFPVVRQGDQFLIAGETYTARENHRPTQDGTEHTVPLKKG